jgi:DNA-binding NarL/FixJ family response regulator
MTPDELRDARMAKADRMRAIREREVAAFESQVLVKAGKRDEYGQPVRKKSRPREVKTKPKKPSAPAAREGAATRRQEAKRLHDEGLGTTEIAKRLGITPRNTRRHMVALGINLEPRRGSEKKVPDQTLVDLHAQGLTNRQIAEKANLARDTVRKRLVTLGLQYHPVSRRKQENA